MPVGTRVAVGWGVRVGIRVRVGVIGVGVFVVVMVGVGELKAVILSWAFCRISLVVALSGRVIISFQSFKARSGRFI